MLITVVLALFAAEVSVEQGTRSMSAHQPGQLADHERFLDLFGNDEDLLLTITHPQLLTPAVLDLLAEVTRRLSDLEGVRRVFSLSNARQLVSSKYGAEIRPLLPSSDNADFARVLLAALSANPEYEGLLISTDRKTAGLVISLKDQRGDPAQRSRLIGEVRELMANLGDRAEFHLTGVGVQQSDVAGYIQRDQRVILPMVAIALMVMLAVIFRRLSGILLPLLATGISLIWTMGLYVLGGFELNTITSLLSPVVMVLAISNCVHIYNGWLHLDGADDHRIALLVDKVDELFVPCLFTALTTALGLVSLTISSVPAVRQFGLFAAVGVMISFLVSLTLVPIVLSYLPLPGRRYRDGLGLLRWTLQAIAGLTVRHPLAIMLVALLLLGMALTGLPRLENNTALVAFLHTDAPLAVDTRYIDEHLAGVNALEFILEKQDGSPLAELDDYTKLVAFEALAQHQQPVTSVFSILSLLRQLHRAESGSQSSELPADDDELHYELDLLGMAEDQYMQSRFLTPDLQTARISVWLHDVGSRSAAAVTDKLLEQGRALFGSDYRLTPTGSFYQMNHDSNRLVADMVKSFSLSIGLVLLSILVLLRSLRLTLLAMIPNVIPILWALGLMGFCGIDLSTGTAMIGAVVFGLAVDDTIHYLVHYRRIYAGVAREAVTTTTTRTGRALMIASLVLAVGFWVGCFSSFKPTVYFSLLVGGTLLGALICDLLVLPACLILNCPSRKGVR
ncbi:MAG: MMPL family transporter [Desulfuromonadales bacterium]|nr:MMPL family transporter [Desulfuromonadales bacterium]